MRSFSGIAASATKESQSERGSSAANINEAAEEKSGGRVVPDLQKLDLQEGHGAHEDAAAVDQAHLQGINTSNLLQAKHVLFHVYS